MRLIESATLRTAFLVVALFCLLAGDTVRYTIGWVGFIVLAAVMGALAVALLIAQRKSWSVNRLPYPLLAFLLLTVASLVWSFYPSATALGIAATWLTAVLAVAVAVTYSLAEVLRALGIALRALLALSFAFEMFVSVVVRRPILPLISQPGVDYSDLPSPVPPMFYWSRNELPEVLDGGKLQGVLGNSVLFSFVALAAIIVFSLQLADRTARRAPTVLWLAAAVLALIFTRSATNILGLVAVAVVAVAVMLVRRADTPRAKVLTYGSITAVVVAGSVSALLLRTQLLGLLGKSGDLTNRTEIWNSVIALAQQKPALGWGWVSYWVPWVAPFDTLASNNGVRQLHAHDAWIDLWFQVGIVGLVIFAALVLSTAQRSWSLAVDRPIHGRGEPGSYTALSLLPILLLTALLVQSIAESRLLVEFGLFTLVLVASRTKLQRETT